jgi:hypothetical protein
MSTPENETPAQPAAAPAAQPTVVQAAPTNTLAIITIIAAFVLPIAGIITGHIALKQLKTSGESGHALAKWGLILSYVFVGIGVVVFIFWMIFAIVLAGMSAATYTY